MGQKVLIVGESGTGKSTSFRNFAKDEVCMIKAINKQLPFRGKFEETHVTDKASEIIRKMKATDKKVIVIDDCQYTMGNEFFRRALEKGYDKFSEIGQNFFNILSATDDLPEDVIVYIVLHTYKDDLGNIKIKSIGKMLDEKLTIEGTSTIVLMSNIVDGQYVFQTQNGGHDVCKSPMGMFSNFLIDNDLKMVDGIIREFYELSDVKPEEKGVSAEKPTRASRRSTRQAAEKQAEESAKQLAGVEDYEPTNDTIPPLDEEEPVEEKPKRRERKKIDDGLTDEERAKFKAEMEAKNKAYEEDMAKLPQRKKRDVTEISDTEVVEDTRGMVVPQKVETADAKPQTKTLAEKLAASGVEIPTGEEAPVRTRRRRTAN